MASFHHLLQHTKQRVESPAKVFAKLKSKVQREEMFAKEEGDFKGKDPLRGLKEKHGGEFKSPRKRADSAWSSTDELTENYRSASYRSEAQALTLSPISSPQKNFRPLEDMHPREGGFLESTSLTHSPFLLNWLQVHADPPQIRDKFKLGSRTPVKMQPVEKDCVKGVFQKDCVRGVFQEAHAPLDRLTSPTQAFSPVKKRLRKTKSELQEFSKITSSTREMGSEASSRPRRRKISTSEDDSCNNTSMEDLGRVRASSDDQVARETAFPLPRSAEMKDFSINVEKLPPMSPAKMFTYMKERESKAQQQETHKVSSSTRDFFDGDNFHLSRDSPPPTAHNRVETEDTAFRSVPESVPPVSLSTVESADSHLDTDISEGAPIPAEPPQPRLLEDPLVLNTPRVSIPKKHNAAFKRNKLPQLAKFPSESVIHLKKWFLRKNHNGLFVDGIHQEENIPWNSNIIVERVSDNVLKTVSGRIYILVGKMIVDIDSVFPNWLLKKFVNGFPPNWKKLYEKFLSEEDPSSESITKSDGRGVKAKTKSVKSSVSKPATQQKPLKTPKSCPPPSLTSAKVSRSGRIIKPPLEYWRGGRVILDAHMNVTIHECYDTSICIPEVTTTVSGRALRNSSHVFLPQSEGRKQLKSSSSEEASAPLRRVKATVRKHNTAKVNLEEKPSDSLEPPVRVLSSSEERSGRTTWSSHRIPPPEMTYVDAGPQKRSEAEKAPTQRSNEQRHDTKKPAVRTSERKSAVTTSPESPFNSEGSQHLLSDDDIFTGQKKRGKRGNKVLNKSRQSHLCTSSSEERETELRKKTRVTVAPQTLIKHKQSKCTKTLSPTKPLPTQPIRSHKVRKGKAPIPQEQEEDEWTETELMKLEEAVSLYPKHMAGYWAKVAKVVGTRSAEECHNQHTSQGSSQTPAKKPKKSKKLKMEPPKNPATDHPVISARVGTLKRKQQVRQFLEAMPREDVEDVFSSAYMQNKRFEMPSMCPSEDNDFTLSELAPTTPMSTGFPDAKTPQCLHITPGMMGSPNRSNDDKYVYQLQKRMKKSQFNVCKQAPSSKSFTPTPSVKRTMKRCGNTENNTFVVWEMFPGNDGALSESGEEEDFYFSDND